jgi:undecaprenyl-diphosphatase
MEVYREKGLPVMRWVAAIVMGVFFITLSVLAGMNQLDGLDQPIYGLFVTDRTAGGIVFMKLMTVWADTWIIAVFCLALVVLNVRLKLGFPVVGATLISVLFRILLKLLVDRPRPDQSLWMVGVSDSSFPSGHACVSVVFYLFLMTILRRHLIIGGHRMAANVISVVLPLLVVLIGLSRIYLGVHYPTDVVGGWLLGGILLIAFITLYDYVWPPQYRVTYEPPAWKDPLRKGRKWKHPQTREDLNVELVEFPKTRGPWRHPRVAKKGEEKEEPASDNENNYAESEEFIPPDDD